MSKQLLLASAFLTLAGCAVTPEPQAGSQPTENPMTWSSRLKSPVTHPTTFESPVIQSNVRPMIIHQQMPGDSVFQGGNFQVYAVQLRYQVDERLALIATKDGYIDFHPKAGLNQDGFADLAAGAKYALVDEPNLTDDMGLLVTAGAVIELPTGEQKVFQNAGDGILRPFVAAGVDLPELNINILANVGISVPFDEERNSSSIDYHVHVGYDGLEHFYPLVEFNAVTYTKSGSRLPLGIEGDDLINLGSTGVAGNTVAQIGVGGRVAVTKDIDVGFAFEKSIGPREDLFEQRWTFDCVWRF